MEGDLTPLAEVTVRLIIESASKKIPNLENMQIQALEVRLLPADPRKIPWLWEATATTAYVIDPLPPGAVSKRSSGVWQILLQLTPEVKDDWGTFWSEVTETRSGKKIRNHDARSEWTRKFRSQVNAGWLKTFQGYQNDLRSHPEMTEWERQRELTAYKSDFCGQYKITIEELQEILEATD